MYYFRDCYFDQQLAFGVARASLARPRRTRASNAPRQMRGSIFDLVTPFLCIGVTFTVGFLVLDVFGLEHLVRTPSFEWLGAYAEHARTSAAELLSNVPRFTAG